MDGAEAGTVTSSHVLVQGLNSLGTGHLTELLVHVVGARARVVADPDTEVLNLQRALLVDLNRMCEPNPQLIAPGGDSSGGRWPIFRLEVTYHIEADDLTVGLLDLLELGQEVPEARLGHNSVRRKDAHAVQLGRRVRLGGQVTPDDLVLVETT